MSAPQLSPREGAHLLFSAAEMLSRAATDADLETAVDRHRVALSEALPALDAVCQGLGDDPRRMIGGMVDLARDGMQLCRESALAARELAEIDRRLAAVMWGD